MGQCAYAGWRTTLIGLVLQASLALQAVTQTATPVRVADASCKTCHRQIFDRYVTTPMANASGAAAENLKTGEHRNMNASVTYSIALRSGAAFLDYQQVDPPVKGTHSLDYFLGSGHLGTTYLYLLDGYLLESPIAFYQGSGLDMKPGIPARSQLANALPVEPACLRCHMSAVQHSDAGSINHYAGLPFLHTGITCEACHGNSEAHRLSGGKGPIVNPAKLEETRRDAVCISCHLEGDISVEKHGYSALDYRPGDVISDYLAYFVFAGKNATVRGVSEVEQFAESQCKLHGGAAMSCTSCHDPHTSPAAADRVQFYRAKCLTCHNSTTFIASHHPEQADCTSCHMPKNGSENIPHVAWTDHRILKQPETLPDAPGEKTNATGREELRPLLTRDAATRDLALAYYNASFRSGRVLQQKAYELLNTNEAGIADDPPALDAFGVMAAQQGDIKTARDAFDKSLKAQPQDFSGAINLGTLLAQSGQLSQAVEVWKSVYQRNQDIPGLALNLSLAQCKLGDPQAAQSTLQFALKYSPGEKQIIQSLQHLPACGARSPETR